MVAGRPTKFDDAYQVTTKIEVDENRLLKTYHIPANVAMTYGMFMLIEPRVLADKNLSSEDIQEFNRIRSRGMERIRSCLLQDQITRMEQTTLPVDLKPAGTIIPPESPVRVWNAFDYPRGQTEYIPRSRFDPEKYELKIGGKDIIHVIDAETGEVVQVSGSQWMKDPKRYQIRLGGL